MSSCSVAIRGLYVIVEEIIQRILNSAEVLGVNLCPILNEQLKCRRSLEGRRLVHAILEAAKEDEIMDNPNPDLILAENGAQPVFSNGSVSPMVENQSAVENNSSTVGLTVLVKDLESNLRKVGRMQETVNHFLAMLLNDSDTAK